jgi:hypothetical protein
MSVSYSNYEHFEITNYDEDHETINRNEWIDIFENRGLSRLETIDSEEKADIYVKNIFEYIEKWEVIGIYYNIERKEIKQYINRRKKYQYKGSGDNNINNTNINKDIMNDNTIIYEMLMYADTIHDFKTMDSFNIDMFYMKKKYLFPIDMTIEILLKEQLFIEYISSRKKLVFVSKTVDNPLYGFSIDTYDIKKKAHEKLKINFEELSKSNYKSTEMRSKNNKTKSLSVDLWFLIDEIKSKEKMKISIIESKQIIKMIYYMKKWFSYNDTVGFNFQLDSNNQLIDIIVGLSFIHTSLNKHFILDKELNDFIYHMNLHRDKNKWVTTKSDSNMFDPSEVNRELLIDNRPTGNIYKSGYTFQISYDKVISNISDSNRVYKQHIKCKITGKDSKNKDKVLNIDVDDRLANKYFSINSINIISSTVSQNSDDVKIPSISLSKFDRDTLYAIKRAGDWGQVEHSKKYNKIFVTEDRMAALYAYFRGVPCILLRKKLLINENEVIESHPSFAQFSFVLLKGDILSIR